MPRVWNKRDPNVPGDAVYVGRPTKWGNPFVIGKDGSREVVIAKYATYIVGRYTHKLHELRGKDLVCWCHPLPCHADVLLDLANA